MHKYTLLRIINVYILYNICTESTYTLFITHIYTHIHRHKMMNVLFFSNNENLKMAFTKRGRSNLCDFSEG